MNQQSSVKKMLIYLKGGGHCVPGDGDNNCNERSETILTIHVFWDICHYKMTLCILDVPKIPICALQCLIQLLISQLKILVIHLEIQIRP